MHLHTRNGLMRRVGGPVLLVAIAVSGAACSSGSAPSSTSPPAATAPSSDPAAGSGNSGGTGMMALANCLGTYGIKLQRIGALLGLAIDPGTTPISDSTLRKAGQACTNTAGDMMPTLQSLDSCLTQHGVSTAHSGSTLTDLLLLNPNSSDVKKAGSACQYLGGG